MRAEPHTVLVAGSADPLRGRFHQFASARPEILVASSTGPAADCEALSMLRSCAIELDVRSDAGARSLAWSIRYGIDTVFQGSIASGTVGGRVRPNSEGRPCPRDRDRDAM